MATSRYQALALEHFVSIISKIFPTICGESTIHFPIFAKKETEAQKGEIADLPKTTQLVSSRGRQESRLPLRAVPFNLACRGSHVTKPGGESRSRLQSGSTWPFPSGSPQSGRADTVHARDGSKPLAEISVAKPASMGTPEEEVILSQSGGLRKVPFRGLRGLKGCSFL